MRILCVDAGGDEPIVGLVIDVNDVTRWRSSGLWSSEGESCHDLVIVEEVDEAEEWDEDAERSGYSIGLYGVTKSIGLSKSIFATEKQAGSAFAMARISQIMANDERFGGIITDEEWDNNQPKYIIERIRNKMDKDVVCSMYSLLAFHTPEQRALFLEEYEDLVKDYLMVSM